jgi:hypothetical protein
MSRTLKRVVPPIASAMRVSNDGPSKRVDDAGAMPERIEAWPLQCTRFARPSGITRNPENTETLSLTAARQSSSGVIS